jgi:hypothetical protein
MPFRAPSYLYSRMVPNRGIVGLRSQPFTPNEAVLSEINSSLTMLRVQPNARVSVVLAWSVS